MVIVEIGGTVGDIEGLPFLEAIRQMRVDVGRENTVYIHVTLLPHISSTGEIKTKPTQHSVRELRGIGIQPDIIVARSDQPIDEDIRAKIALFCDVEERGVISLVTTPIIYEVPLILEEAGWATIWWSGWGWRKHTSPDLEDWQAVVEDIRRPKPPIRVGLVGKYVELHDAYLSVREALHHAGLRYDVAVEIDWIDAEEIERHGAERLEDL